MSFSRPIPIPSLLTARLVSNSNSEIGQFANSVPSHGDEIVVSNLLTPGAKRSRSRASRTSLLGSSASSGTSTPAVVEGHKAPSANVSGRRSSRLSAVESASASSAQTPQELSSDDDYSTPATSKVPTPLASASTSAKMLRPSLQVQLPARPHQPEYDDERQLRSSVYSIKPRQNNAIEISDSEDGNGNYSDFTRDSRTARRLQLEEYSKAGSGVELPYPLGDRTNRHAKKRGRVSSRSALELAPSGKKAKVIPDSDDLDPSDIDMDAEIAAAVVLDSDLSDPPIVSDNDNPFIQSDAESTGGGQYDDVEEEEEDDDDIYADSEEDEPMSNRKGKQPMKPRPEPVGLGKETMKRAIASAMNHRAARLVEELAVDGTKIETPPPGQVNEPDESSALSEFSSVESGIVSVSGSDAEDEGGDMRRIAAQRRAYRRSGNKSRLKKERDRLEHHHPEIVTMWDDLEKTPVLKPGMAPQPSTISRRMKGFQLEGLAWMKAMEQNEWKGGLLGDEMGLGKTIQAVSLIMSDYPAKQPSLVLVPPVALMQWQSEIKSYTDGTLKTFVFHGTNQKAKNITVKELKAYDVIMMSYNSLESMYRKQERGFKRKDGIHKQKSVIHSIHFHRIILDEAHSIKTRSTMTAKACFALNTDYRWCLTGTPLQNRIGEFFSLIRFLNIRPFALYLCKQCPCSTLEWSMNEDSRCSHCNHAGMQHVSVFNQELLNPIQKFGNVGPGREAFRKLRLMTDRIMLRRLKRDHTNAMELPVKEIYVDRQFFGEEENDFANSIMTNGQRKFDTYVAQGVLLNNYANIFGLIMQMRQVADHPDLILKKNAERGQNVLICCICDEPAEDTVRSRCKHDFCRACVGSYVRSTDEPDCPRCHIALAIDLEQPEIEQDENMVKKNSIINRIKMENWTSSSKIELLVHELHKLRSNNASHKSIIFSQFTTMLQLIEWRLRRAGITTVMLDGSMTPAQRQASIDHFMTNVNVECFLVSLKAGGVALNLTEASRVFIVDP